MFSKEIMTTLRPFFRGLPLTLVLVMVGMWLAGKYVSYVTPVYESTARIKLADNEQGPTGSRLYDDMDFFATENKISAEIELIKSNTILEKVVKHLPEEYIIYRVGNLHSTELYDQSPVKIYSVINDSSLLDRPFQLSVHGETYTLITPDEKTFKGKLGRSVTIQNSEFLIARNEVLLSKRPDMLVNDNYRFVLKSKAKLVAEIRSNLDVMAMDKDVPVIRISYKSPVPQKAHDIVNLVAGCYIRDYEDTKFLTADTTVTFLDKQLKQYAEELRGSETNIEDYRNSENIINIRQETETDLRKISDMKKQLSNMRMNLAAIDTLNNYIRQGDQRFMELAPNFEAFNDLLSTEMVKKIRSYQAEKKELLTLYTGDHEKIRVIDENIHDLVSYIKESIRNTKINTETKLSNLETEIYDAESAFNGLPSRERTLTGLERENQMNESIFRFLHEKKTEAEIARAAKMSFHRIIDFGQVPKTPTSPNPGLFKALAAFLAFLFGTFLSYLIFKIRFKIGDESFIQKRSLIPVIKAIPFFKNRVQEQLYFTQWASVLWLNEYFAQGKVVCFASLKNGNQKEFIIDRLATALQLMGKKTIVLYAHSHAEFDTRGKRYSSALIDKYLNSDQSWNHEMLNEYDCILCDPGSLDQEGRSFLLMSGCRRRILVFDALNSSGSEVDQANEINDTLSELNLEIVLNRTQYFPALIGKDRIFATLDFVRKHLGNLIQHKGAVVPKFKQAHR
jgi:uncharacterized protein involved in exopolysaccharide biosynthesis